MARVKSESESPLSRVRVESQVLQISDSSRTRVNKSASRSAIAERVIGFVWTSDLRDEHTKWWFPMIVTAATRGFCLAPLSVRGWGMFFVPFLNHGHVVLCHLCGRIHHYAVQGCCSCHEPHSSHAICQEKVNIFFTAD